MGTKDITLKNSDACHSVLAVADIDLPFCEEITLIDKDDHKKDIFATSFSDGEIIEIEENTQGGADVYHIPIGDEEQFLRSGIVRHFQYKISAGIFRNVVEEFNWVKDSLADKTNPKGTTSDPNENAEKKEQNEPSSQSFSKKTTEPLSVSVSIDPFSYPNRSGDAVDAPVTIDPFEEVPEPLKIIDRFLTINPFADDISLYNVLDPAITKDPFTTPLPMKNK